MKLVSPWILIVSSAMLLSLPCWHKYLGLTQISMGMQCRPKALCINFGRSPYIAIIGDVLKPRRRSLLNIGNRISNGWMKYNLWKSRNQGNAFFPHRWQSEGKGAAATILSPFSRCRLTNHGLNQQPAARALIFTSPRTLSSALQSIPISCSSPTTPHKHTSH